MEVNIELASYDNKIFLSRKGFSREIPIYFDAKKFIEIRGALEFIYGKNNKQEIKELEGCEKNG